MIALIIQELHTLDTAADDSYALENSSDSNRFDVAFTRKANRE